MRGRQGYTLVEMMAGVAIVGILAVASVPNVSSYLRSRNAANSSSQVGAHLRMARSRAILEGNDYLVQFTGENSYVVVDDDGGGSGLPGNPDYVAANRGNRQADDNETVLGPYTLPEGMVFASAGGATNPFTGQAIASAVTFPQIGGSPTAVFRPNGTAEDGGYVAVAPAHEVAHDRRARCRVLQVTSSTGSVASRSATGS